MALVSPHRWDGGRLRVLDATSRREVAELLRDHGVQKLVTPGSDWLYVLTPTAAYDGTQLYQVGDTSELMAAYHGAA